MRTVRLYPLVFLVFWALFTLVSVLKTRRKGQEVSPQAWRKSVQTGLVATLGWGVGGLLLGLVGSIASAAVVLWKDITFYDFTRAGLDERDARQTQEETEKQARYDAAVQSYLRRKHARTHTARH